MARLERFELPTARFVAEYSIQLSYRRRTETLIMLFMPYPVNNKFTHYLKYQDKSIISKILRLFNSAYYGIFYA